MKADSTSVAFAGNAPTLMSLRSLKRVAPTWMNTSKAIFDDKEAHEAWGWVLEMYAFTIACHLEGVPPATLHIKMMGQPPWDTALWPYYLLHYTYGMDYTLEVSIVVLLLWWLQGDALCAQSCFPHAGRLHARETWRLAFRQAHVRAEAAAAAPWSPARWHGQ